MKILVLDTETTGFNDDGEDLIVEISIVELDTKKRTLTKLYDEVLGYPIHQWSNRLKKAWIFANGYISLQEVVKGKEATKVITEVRNIMRGKRATSYNVSFDFGNFLSDEPWNINNEHQMEGTFLNRMLKEGKLSGYEYLDYIQMPCIMIAAANVCKIPSRYGYKWPKLDEAMRRMNINKDFDCLLDDELKEVENDRSKRHRALYDTIQASKILLWMIDKGYYNI